MATTSFQARAVPQPLSSSLQDETLVLDDGIFTDKKSGKQFRLFKYFDHEVIQDVETSWINAGKFVQDVSKSPSLSKRKENSKIDFLNRPWIRSSYR